MTQSHDTTHSNVAAEGKRNDNHVAWRHHQTDGAWLSSPPPNGSQHIFQDVSEESKSLSVGPVFSGYTAHNLSKKSNDQMLDQHDEGKKTEASNSFRLFGFEMRGHSTNPPPAEKVARQPISVSTANTEGQASAFSVAESEPKYDSSKASKEPEQLQVSSRESLSKKSCMSSARSCTKVL